MKIFGLTTNGDKWRIEHDSLFSQGHCFLVRPGRDRARSEQVSTCFEESIALGEVTAVEMTS